MQVVTFCATRSNSGKPNVLHIDGSKINSYAKDLMHVEEEILLSFVSNYSSMYTWVDILIVAKML